MYHESLMDHTIKYAIKQDLLDKFKDINSHDETEPEYERRLCQEAQLIGVNVPPVIIYEHSSVSSTNSPTRPKQGESSLSSKERIIPRSIKLEDLYHNRCVSQPTPKTSDRPESSSSGKDVVSIKSNHDQSLIASTSQNSFSSTSDHDITHRPRKKLSRVMSRFRLRRRDSNTPSEDQPSIPDLLYPLNCGHCFPPNTLQIMITTSLENDPEQWPMCCNVEIPKSLIDNFSLLKTSRSSLSQKSSLNNDDALNIVQNMSPKRDSLSPCRRSSFSEPVILDQGLLERNLSRASSSYNFLELRQKQIKQRNILNSINLKHRSDQQIKFNTRYRYIHDQFLSLERDLYEKHNSSISLLEDQHLLAESDLLDLQAHSINIIPNFSQTLNCHYNRTKDALDIKHRKELINLRAEQINRLQHKRTRFKAELTKLQQNKEEEEKELKRQEDNDERLWISVVEYHKRKMERWWKIENEVWIVKEGNHMNIEKGGMMLLNWDDHDYLPFNNNNNNNNNEDEYFEEIKSVRNVHVLDLTERADSLDIYRL